MINDDDYKKRFEEVNKRLADPKISDQIDKYLQKIAKLADCDVELNFTVIPHLDDYIEIQESEEYEIPEFPTMKLSDFLDHMNKEKFDYDVFIDPLYLKKGVNEIIDMLVTTVDRKIIIVPISNNKKTKL